MLADSLIRRVLFAVPLLVATLAFAPPPRVVAPPRTDAPAARGDRAATSAPAAAAAPSRGDRAATSAPAAAAAPSRGDRATPSARAADAAAATAGLAVDPASVSADVWTGDEATRTLALENPGGAPIAYRLRVRTAPAAGTLRATLPSRLTGGGVLLVEDRLPWGSTADEDLLRAAGAELDRIPAAALATTDLDAYSLVVIASDQDTPFYGTLGQQAARLAAWVAAGGTLEAQLAGWGAGGGDASQLELPGAVRAQPRRDFTNQVVAPGHPIVAGVSPTFTGTPVSHGYLAGLPADAEVLAVDHDGGPTLAVYGVGLGVVIAGVQAYEYGVVHDEPIGQVLRNLVAFALAGGRSHWLRFEPSAGTLPPGSSATISLRLASEGLAPGEYAQELVILSDDPVRPSVTVPVHMRVTDAPRLEVSGWPAVLASYDATFTSGVSRHRFELHAMSPSRIEVGLRAEGNYGRVGGIATVVVEGVTLGKVGATSDQNTCATADGAFPLTGAALAAVLADSVVNVEVRDSPVVDPARCDGRYHQVALSFREALDPVRFADTFLGACGTSEVWLRNTGTAPLVLGGFEMSRAEFTSTASPVTVPPGGETRVLMTFCPSSAGTLEGTWTLSSNDPRGERRDLTLRGRGVVPPRIAAVPRPLVEDLFPGERSVRALEVWNHGGSDLLAWLRLELDAAQPGQAAATAPEAPLVPPPTTILADDMEGGAGGWTSHVTSGGSDHWSRSQERAGSGSWSWNARHVGSEPGASTLQSPDLDLTGFGSARLTFRHLYRFGCAGAPSFTPYGGIVEAQAVGDVAWQQLIPVDNYPSAVVPTQANGQPCPNPLAGRPAYARDGDDAGAFLTATFDLSPYAGRVMRFRFHAGWGCEGSNDCGPSEGWYVDDVTVTASAPLWLSLSPTSLTVPPGGHGDASLAFDTEHITPGDWNAVVDVFSNDPETRRVTVPVTLHVANVAATLALDHRTLEPGQGGPWLRAALTLPQGRTLADLDLASVALNGVPAERVQDAGDAVPPGRGPSGQPPRLIFRADRAAVLATFGETSPQVMNLSGAFTDGQRFLARDTVALRGAATAAAALAPGGGAAPDRDSLATAPLVPSFALAPNPARQGSAVRVLLALPSGGRIEAEVYSLTGQLVRTLAAGSWPAGRTALEWDGRDRGGHEVGPGIYLVRVRAPGIRATRRAVLLR